MHEAAYRALHLDATFAVYDVKPPGFGAKLAELRAQGLTQLCVSLPHKEAALQLADRVSDAARAIGAANTLTSDGGELRADNTDWLGVTRALEPHGPWQGKRATVLGAGGAARAVVYALRRFDMDVCVVNRTAARAQRLAADLGARVGSLDEPWDLLVNATSLGMVPDVDSTPAPAESLRPGALVFDTVYRPLETRLLREARLRGCRTQDGLEMLVQQAVEQIRLWSGKRPEPAVLRDAALAVLEG
jgi:shikimate dehydrogenase